MPADSEEAVFEPVVANEAGSPCRDDEAGLLQPTRFPEGTPDNQPHMDLGLLWASTDASDGGTPTSNFGDDSAHAEAGVALVVLSDGENTLIVRVANARADARCAGPGEPNLTSSSEVLSVTIQRPDEEDVTITLPEENQSQTIPGGDSPLQLHLNSEQRTGNTITRRAVWLQTPLGDLIVSEAVADFTGRPCEPKQPPCPDQHQPGAHEDDNPFSEPLGDGEDSLHLRRSIIDSDRSPNGSFCPSTTGFDDPESEERFNADVGFLEEDSTEPEIEKPSDDDHYEDEDMGFRLVLDTIDAYLAPNDDPNSEWRRFCGTGTIVPSEDSDSPDEPVAPFASGQERKYLIEAKDEDFQGDDSGGNRDDFVIDIYAVGSDFDTENCRRAQDGGDHEGDDIDYHAEDDVLRSGNISIDSDRAGDGGSGSSGSSAKALSLF